MEQDNNTVNTQVDVPVSVPEQNNMMAEGNEKKKGGNGVLIGLVLCVIAAVAGIGFGVWAMMDGDRQKDNYEEQINILKQRIDELEEKNEELAEQVNNNEEVDEIENSETIDDVTTYDGFMVITEWGYKVKIPDGLRNVDYRFSDNGDGSSSVHVVGIVSDEPVESDNLPMFADFSRNSDGLMEVKRMERKDGGSCKESLFSDDDYIYCSGRVDAEMDSAKYNEGETTPRFWYSIETVRKMMRNKVNYIKL